MVLSQALFVSIYYFFCQEGLVQDDFRCHWIWQYCSSYCAVSVVSRKRTTKAVYFLAFPARIGPWYTASVMSTWRYWLRKNCFDMFWKIHAPCQTIPKRKLINLRAFLTGKRLLPLLYIPLFHTNILLSSLRYGISNIIGEYIKIYGLSNN